jgi:hypothetical protein
VPAGGAIAGIAGLGHILLTIGLVLLSGPVRGSTPASTSRPIGGVEQAVSARDAFCWP